VSEVHIPSLLAAAVRDDDIPERRAWLARLPEVVDEAARMWELDLGEPFEPGGSAAWVAPAITAAGDERVLKAGWRHWEADHEAEGLLAWHGHGAVRCLASQRFADTTVLLLERCRPGVTLAAARPERDQDAVIAELLLRLWAAPLHPDAPFRPLQFMCDRWADTYERRLAADARGFDPELGREGAAALRALPRSAKCRVLLCTDLHAGNVLSAEREPWLAIDPKPFVGDPAYDVVQHMLNCDERLAADPAGLARRMAGLVHLNAERVTRWLLARCAQESLSDLSMREPARRLASALG
jgi:streptomycin 6-kinase